MISDYEILYMLRQNSEDATEILLEKFENLAWKASHDGMYVQRPQGIQDNDLYQEARLGIMEALHTYRIDKDTGLAHYVKICVLSHVNTRLRKCRSASYLLLDSSRSLDMSITEDGCAFLGDVVTEEYLPFNPQHQAIMEEARELLYDMLSTLPKLEQIIFQSWNMGYTYTEIGSILNIAPKVVDNKIQKIKKRAIQLAN